MTMTTFHHTRQLRLLFAADYFCRVSRDASKIAAASGLSITEVYELCQTPEWTKAVEMFGYTGTAKVANVRRYRRRKRSRALVVDTTLTPLDRERRSLNYAEELWDQVFGFRPENSKLRRHNRKSGMFALEVSYD